MERVREGESERERDGWMRGRQVFQVSCGISTAQQLTSAPAYTHGDHGNKRNSVNLNLTSLFEAPQLLNLTSLFKAPQLLSIA